MPMSLGMEDYHRPVVDERAIDPVPGARGAGAASPTARARRWPGATAAAILGVVLIAMGEPRFGFPPLLGAVVGLAVAAVARADRHALVRRLVRQRSAYEIEEVAAAADRLVTRRRLRAGRARRGPAVLEAEGLAPAQPRAPPAPRARARVPPRALAIAFHLARGDARVHPTSLLLLQRILTATQTSPLYRADGSVATLRAALRRVEAGIDAGPLADDD